MTDQIPADKVRELVDGMRESMRRAECDGTNSKFMGSMSVYVAALAALLPPPPRPTLADMTDDERFNSVGMWADVEGFHPYRAVIDGIPAPKVPVFRPTAGSLDWVHPADVTPLPELGRAWSPGGSPIDTPAPAPSLPDGWRLADHPDYGLVLVTSGTPDEGGLVAFVHRDDDLHRGHGYDWCKPDELTYIDQEADTADTVPESTLAVGSVWHDADALEAACEETGRDQIVVLDRTGDAYVWGAYEGGWETGEPYSGFEPYTILHAGKESDQ